MIPHGIDIDQTDYVKECEKQTSQRKISTQKEIIFPKFMGWRLLNLWFGFRILLRQLRSYMLLSSPQPIHP